jgi:aldose 1-epimerase
VQAKVVYSIPADGSDLSIVQSATTDKATPINMLNHAYFNLKGLGNGDILDHVVQVRHEKM